MRYVAGADEAGRGCLAGPLVAAAVLFDYERIGLRELRSLSALNDSKQHSEEMREELYPRVLRAATCVAVTSRCARGIDERGLHVTNLRALSDMLRRVGRPGCLALSDGFRVPDTGWEQRHVVGGDATSAAIAAASVIAKVTRDRLMGELHERYPCYDFATHKGYSTPTHEQALRAYGPCEEHRFSYINVASRAGRDAPVPPRTVVRLVARSSPTQDAAARTMPGTALAEAEQVEVTA